MGAPGALRRARSAATGRAVHQDPRRSGLLSSGSVASARSSTQRGLFPDLRDQAKESRGRRDASLRGGASFVSSHSVAQPDDVGREDDQVPPPRTIHNVETSLATATRAHTASDRTSSAEAACEETAPTARSRGSSGGGTPSVATCRMCRPIHPAVLRRARSCMRSGSEPPDRSRCRCGGLADPAHPVRRGA
jgi:hypothetical protein